MSTTEQGRQAETMVAQFLCESGHELLLQNWRVRQAEIDVITKKGEVVYFTEVKYRKNNLHGDGLEYITSSKLKQMHFAADLWLAENNWDGDYRLLAAAVNSSGQIEVVEC